MKSIGRYEIRAMLGQGGMGRVYKVVIPGIQKVAAVKSLQPGPKLVETMGMDRLREQFVREASIIANIRHPHIVEIWSLEETEDQLFYVMEYFCHNLGTLIGEAYWADAPTRVVRVEKAVQVILEVLQGLSRLHHAGIIHRDIKPFNIMFTDSGTVKIVDFGLSRKRGEAPAEKAGTLIGTGFYAAPEQIASPEKADHRADLYSTGIMLYRMITGKLPGPVFEPPGSLNPDLDASWDQLIVKATDPNPEKRFQDAKSMGEEIREVYGRYRKRKEMDCPLPDALAVSAESEKDESPLQTFLRSQAGLILAKQGKAAFGIDDLYRPKTYIRNRMEAVHNDFFMDHATGLIWQRAGSEYPVSFRQAQDYVEKINEQKAGGHDSWRLPTVNELLSLLNPPPPGEDFCFASPFSSVQKWIWSGDTRSVRASWMVNFEMGFVMSGDVMDFFYVRAVCSL
ncbi:MAG: DUF1566 domain-containing protein [Desulfobacteraceae bacterium]|nr:MAG: DUF1566 domain-containing protein [Desulfobacteraceae bacterium]